ncbi:hypothetical protein Btru_023914 [Bulinus truncatus]|nr:hypothetical protein Btru_023914 [Bulinus truncatus]
MAKLRTLLLSLIWLSFAYSKKANEGIEVSLFGESFLVTPLRDTSSTTWISFEFYTHLPHGLLFLAAGHTDYIIIQLVEGAVEARVNLGFGEAIASSTRGVRLDNSQWHSVVLNRTKDIVHLVVDGSPRSEMVIPGRDTELDINIGFYLGGVGNLKKDFISHSRSYRGCIRQVYYNEQNILENLQNSNIAGHFLWQCANEFSIAADLPISFNQNGSFVAFPHFRMAPNGRGAISLEFKTRTTDAVFLFNSALEKSSHFIAVEIIGGKPKLSVNLGNGVTEITTGLFVSDGKWHQLEVIISQKFAQLLIDGTRNSSNFLVTLQSLHLAGHLFIGGLGAKAQQHAVQHGLITHHDINKGSVLGCVRNIIINSYNYGYRLIQISRQISSVCIWEFPCAEDPCVSSAQCTELRGADYRCDCEEANCAKKDFLIKENFQNLNGLLSAGNLDVKEKGSALISPNVIKMNKNILGSVREESISFFVKEPPTEGLIEVRKRSHQNTFTLKDLSENTVYYRHLGGRAKQDSMTIDASFIPISKEPGSSPDHFNFVLPITIINSRKLEIALKMGYLLNVTSGSSLRITQSILSVKSSDVDPSFLRFVVAFLRPTQSGFESSDIPKKPITSFTLKDIQDGKIWFKNKGDNMVYTKINVTDGVATSSSVDLRFRVEELKLFVRNNTGIYSSYGSISLITAANLSTITNVPLEDLEVRYNITVLPTQGMLQRLEHSTSQWMNVTTFTQRHIDSGRIRYLHLPGRNFTLYDSFIFEVTSKSQTSEPSVFRITFKTVTLSIEQNYNLMLNHAHYGKLTNKTLSVVSDANDFNPKNIQFMLIRCPQYGSFYLIKQNFNSHILFERYQPLQLDSVFTQQDINNGFLYYKMDKPTYEKKTDYADLLASYFGFTIMTRAMIEYSPEKLSARLINNGLKDVPEGGSVVITKEDLSLEMDKYKKLKFWITKGPIHGSVNIKDPISAKMTSQNVTSFNMLDILEGRVVYTHDDSENEVDSFTFLVSPLIEESEQSRVEQLQEFSGTFHIAINMKNDNPPIRSVNKVFQVALQQSKRLTLDDLAFKDPDIDFNDSLLTYQRQPISNGEIISAITQEPVYNFSQSDLSLGKLMFKHKGDANARIPLSVSDGKFFTTSLFVIQASSPFIRVINNTGVDVKQGSQVTIYSFNLSIDTNLNLNPEIITFRVIDAPKYGTLRVDGRNTKEFKYEDIIKAKVRYWHQGRTSQEDKVTFSIHLANLQTRVSFTFKVTADGISDPPEIIHNQILKVTALQSEIISENHLNVGHKNYPPHEIEFIITHLPRFGHLVVKGNSIKPGSVPEFSQQDINDGRIVYVSDTSDAVSDKFVFDVGTEFQSLRQLDFLIEIVPQTLQINRLNATVKEGGTLVLDSNLLPFKPQGATGLKSSLTVYQTPVHGQVKLRNGQKEDQVKNFTFEDVNRGKVIYIHDNSESLSDEISVRAEGQEGKLSGQRMVVLLIEVIPVNDQPPLIVVNTGLDLWTGSIQLLTNKQLTASDPDTSSDNIEFRVSHPSNGHLAYLNNTFKQISKFTQRDLDSGSIVFVHKGSETGTFTFQVTDGINSDQSRVFQIRARPVELTVVANNTIKAFPGFAQPITNASLLAKTSSSNFTHPIVFSVLDSWPRKGKLVKKINQKIVEVHSFTQNDINDGMIFYKHTAESKNWTEADMIYLEITTAYAQPLTNRSLRVEISFSNINDDNYQQLLHIKSLNIKEGGKVTINKDLFDTTDFIAKIQSFRPTVDVVFSFMVPPIHGYLWFDGKRAEVGEVFTQENLDNGLLVYKHDNTETLRDRFKFEVKLLVPRAYREHTNSAAQVFKVDIYIQPVNDRGFELITRHPRLTVKQGSDAAIMSHILTTVDLDSGPESIEYTIVTQPSNGRLVKLPDTKTRIISFTQKDINDEKILFKHDGTRKSSDSLYFKVWDGLFEPHFANMNIDVQVLTINVDKDSHVPLVQGSKTVIVTRDHLKVTTDGDYNALTYKLVQLPQFGRLMKLNSPASEFSQNDLDKSFITYTQNRESPGDDYFTCSIRLNNMDCSHDETGFDVVMKPLIKQSPLLTTAGSYVAITRSSLDASELAHLTNDNPRFDVSTYPLYGKIMRRHRLRREANLENHFQTVTSFTFEDILYTKIYYLADKNSDHNGTDNFIYVLSAKGVPSAKGELIIQLSEPTSVPREKDPEKTTPAGRGYNEPDMDSANKNVSKDAVLQPEPSIDEDNNVAVIATVLSLIFIIIVVVVLIVLFLRWRKRRPMTAHETKASKPRPYISGPLQLEQPHVLIEPHDEGLASPVSRDSTALVGGGHGSESEYVNTSHMSPSDEADCLHQLKKGPPGSIDLVDASYAIPGRKTLAQDSNSEQLSEELDRPSTRASGRESNASADLLDWSLMEPDLLQHCRTTTPVLRNNQYWL